MKESPYQVGELETVIWGDGSRVGVAGKESVFGVKFIDQPGGIVIPAGGRVSMYFRVISIFLIFI